MTDQVKRLLIPALLVLASIAIYLPALQYDFVIDDGRQFEVMQSRFTWSQLPSYFTTDVWSYVDQEGGNYYRPIFVVWMLLTFKIGALSHPVWHASAILLNAAAVLMLYLLALRLTENRVTAALATLLFAVHPTHIEEVAWVSGASEPLEAIWFFGTLYSLMVSRQETDKKRAQIWRTVSVVLFLLALFSKETAIVAPVLIFGLAWLFPNRAEDAEPTPIEKRTTRAFYATIPYLQALIFYFGVRYLALGSFSPQLVRWPLRLLVQTLPATAWFYLKELVWPIHLSVFPPVDAVTQPGLMNFHLPILAVALALVALYLVSRRNPVLGFCCLILLVPLLPVFQLRAFPMEDFVHDRYLYIPSAGLCIFAVVLFRKYADKWSMAGQLAAVAPIVVILAVLTVLQTRPWRNSDTIALHAVTVAPQNLTAQRLMAGSLMLAERYGDAIPWFDGSLAKYPENADFNLGVAACYMRTSRWGEAIERLNIVLKKLPKSPQAHLLLGMSHLELGHMDTAEAQMREAVRDRPRASIQYMGYRTTLADLLERKGDLQGAIDEYNRELDEYPDATWVLDRVAALKSRLSNTLH